MSAYDNDRPPFTMAGGINRTPPPPRLTWGRVVRVATGALLGVVAGSYLINRTLQWLQS